MHILCFEYMENGLDIIKTVQVTPPFTKGCHKKSYKNEDCPCPAKGSLKNNYFFGIFLNLSGAII